jgi:predicted nucleic acid-binding protein
MKFWDSSAIVPLCVLEPLSPVIAEIAKEDPDLVVWWGSAVECCSSFARLRRDATLTTTEEDRLLDILEQLKKCWSEVEASEEVRSQAQRLLLRHPLRAADALQLAAALVWTGGNPNRHGFVCLDQRLRDAARSEGFTLVPASMS